MSGPDLSGYVDVALAGPADASGVPHPSRGQRRHTVNRWRYEGTAPTPYAADTRRRILAHPLSHPCCMMPRMAAVIAAAQSIEHTPSADELRRLDPAFAAFLAGIDHLGLPAAELQALADRWPWVREFTADELQALADRIAQRQAINRVLASYWPPDPEGRGLAFINGRKFTRRLMPYSHAAELLRTRGETAARAWGLSALGLVERADRCEDARAQLLDEERLRSRRDASSTGEPVEGLDEPERFDVDVGRSPDPPTFAVSALIAAPGAPSPTR